jgi:phosphorylcholine metabolism protein LicD
VTIARFRTLIVAENYAEADALMRAMQEKLPPKVKRQIMSSLTEEILIARELEWTNHGMRRTFRFHDLENKQRYLRQANAALSAVRKHTPNVCYGFGAVLGKVRDEDFIPHDDDLDLIVGFTLDEAKTFAAAKQIIRDTLIPAGFTLHGDNLSHFGVCGPKSVSAVDLFIGFIEGDKVSWFPSRRKNLNTSDVFPAREITFLGESCQFPANPENYLETTYGSDWRQPISNWMHPWNKDEYADFVSKAA